MIPKQLLERLGLEEKAPSGLDRSRAIGELHPQQELDVSIDLARPEQAEYQPAPSRPGDELPEPTAHDPDARRGFSCREERSTSLVFLRDKVGGKRIEIPPLERGGECVPHAASDPRRLSDPVIGEAVSEQRCHLTDILGALLRLPRLRTLMPPIIYTGAVADALPIQREVREWKPSESGRSNSMSEHDAIVIGLGVGGEHVAGTLAEAGMDVLGIERTLVGGECPYWGCIPTKMMVRASNALAETQRVQSLAGDAHAHADYSPVVTRIKNEATDDWNDQVAVDRLESKGGTFLRGEARFVGAREVEVDGERHRARRAVVIAAGGRPAIPPIPGLDSAEYWTNREAVKATEQPQSMVVLGGGAIGLEIGQAFTRFGTDVTIVEMADHLLPSEEPENAAALEEALRAEGATVNTGVSANSVKPSADGIAVELSDGRVVEAERLLVATGRHLNLPDLALEKAGLTADRGGLQVDDGLRTGDGAWAVGDITGKGAFTHVAMYQARIAAADILGHRHSPADYSAVPRVTFTDPEVASVGMSEHQARQADLSIRVGISNTASSARGWIHGPGAEHGFAKLIADADKNTLVGASVMGPAAGEVIGLLVLAIKQQVSVSDLQDLIYPYPTFVRGIEDALAQLDG